MGGRSMTTFGPDQAAFISFIGIFFPPLAVAIVAVLILLQAATRMWASTSVSGSSVVCQTLSVADDHCLVIGIIHAFWVVAKHTRPSPLPGDIESALYITPPAGSEVNIPISHHSRTARGNGNGNGNGRGRESSIQVPAPVHSNSPRMYEYNLPSGAGSPRAQPAAQGPRSGEITPTRKTTMAEGPFADPAHTGAGSASAPAYQVLAEWKPEGKSGDA
ncbi:hypothetical protein EHS25_009155 [Saitozyma podzolica]|uniref:Uncharacterized protein n=1 Tax=Saitozyma podzolica TaxID=1890683 RepID=A0A427YL04_9TREE|nr:hypothetical protein EHS25_009155 [Saitozyma podzolica]